MKNKNERGALIVEASIVFPVMFLIIFFMIFTGNAYLQKCRVESIINQYAIDGAAYCADPHLSSVEAGKVPALDGLHVYPYRYFGTSDYGYAADVAADVEKNIYEKVTGLSTGLFSGMKPIIRKGDVSADYNNAFLYSTFSVDATYKIEMPIRMMGSDENMYLEISTHVEIPVSDSVEMIRNIDMIWDYMERLGADKKFEEIKAKLEEAFNKVNDWFDGKGGAGNE